MNFHVTTMDVSVTHINSPSINTYSKELARELENHREQLTGIEPNEADFLYVESLTEIDEPVNNSKSDEERFYVTVSYLLDHLSSDNLTQTQKAALFLMIQHRLQK